MKKVWEKWKTLAAKIGDFQFKLIFSLLYFLLVTPLGLLTRNKDLLGTKNFPQWDKMESHSSSLSKLKNQF